MSREPDASITDRFGQPVVQEGQGPRSQAGLFRRVLMANPHGLVVDAGMAHVLTHLPLVKLFTNSSAEVQWESDEYRRNSLVRRDRSSGTARSFGTVLE